VTHLRKMTLDEIAPAITLKASAAASLAKLSAALEARIADDLKQRRSERGSGPRGETRMLSASLATLKARINAGRDRLVAEKKPALARGEEWR
jgi:hypothetical protein